MNAPPLARLVEDQPPPRPQPKRAADRYWCKTCDVPYLSARALVRHIVEVRDAGLPWIVDPTTRRLHRYDPARAAK